MGYIVALLVIGAATVSVAQVPIFPNPTPEPTPREPEPTLTPPPTATPQPTPTPAPTGGVPPVIPTPSGAPKPSPKAASPSPGAAAKPSDELPPGLKENIVVPNLPRTRARNTAELVRLLEPLTKLGMPLQQVLIEGMGRFPVAGLANYFDDWLNPRYTPTFHLHHGLDIFADFGTPIRAPDEGYISALTNGPTGGIGVWMRGEGNVAYYFAHLQSRVEGLRVGQRVQIGTVLGFVGDSGNAKGGTPHLHFEIHPGGGAAIPPKPTVDRWLDEALEIAPNWVKARTQEIQGKQQLLEGPRLIGTSRASRADFETSMLLTLLDPVAGSVGLLPQLELQPARHPPVSDGLLGELVRLRLDGYLLVPSSHSVHSHD